ncbi:hypothetical protein TNCV_4266251 [Trichonephila clavipes]|nr:hypothetical protein TNCV_4266251 [Trichonephila clavipes]
MTPELTHHSLSVHTTPTQGLRASTYLTFVSAPPHEKSLEGSEPEPPIQRETTPAQEFVTMSSRPQTFEEIFY